MNDVNENIFILDLRVYFPEYSIVFFYYTKCGGNI